MVDACAAAAAATPVAESSSDPSPDHSSHPSNPARAAAGPSAAEGGGAEAEAEAAAPAPDHPNPTEDELAEARQRRKWREEHLGQNPDDDINPTGAAGGTPEVDAEGYYEESRWYEFAVNDLAAADGAELVLTDDDGEVYEDCEEDAGTADAAQGAGGAGSSRPGVYRWAESELSAAAGGDAAGAWGTAQAPAREGTSGAPAGGAGAGVAGAAAAATVAASKPGAAAPAAGAPAVAAASGGAVGTRPAPSSPFVVPKVAPGSPAAGRAAGAGRCGAGVAGAPDPAPDPGKAGPTSPLPLPFGGRVGARLQQMGVRASGAAGPTGIGPPAGASTPQATSAHRPRAAALPGLGSGPGNSAPYVQGGAPPPAGGAPSSSHLQAPRTSGAGSASPAARAPLAAPSPGTESYMPGAAAGADVAQGAATALAGGGPEPEGMGDGAPEETAARGAAAGDEEQARPLTAAELRDVAQRRGLSFEALVQGARERGVEVEGA